MLANESKYSQTDVEDVEIDEAGPRLIYTFVHCSARTPRRVEASYY